MDIKIYNMVCMRYYQTSVEDQEETGSQIRLLALKNTRTL